MPETTLVYTVAEFCEAAKISKTTLYELWSRGDGPPRVKLGRRTLIPVRNASAWLDRKAKTAA